MATLCAAGWPVAAPAAAAAADDDDDDSEGDDEQCNMAAAGFMRDSGDRRLCSGLACALLPFPSRTRGGTPTSGR